MSLRNYLVLPVVLSALAFLAACASSTTKGTPPPTGGFSNSNLNGTYVFSTTGSDSTNGFFQTIAGTFIANGSGGITGGVMDINSVTNGVFPAQTISGGSYNVGVDGRPASQGGALTLKSAAGTFQFDYVLTSSEHGLVTEFDANGTGSGTLDLQSSVTQANIDGQSYAFNFTGASTAGSEVICGVDIGETAPAPYATAGAFTLDGSGNMSTGVADFNNNCSSAGIQGLSLSAGSVILSSTAGAPGTATFTASPAGGPFTFDVYPVDTTHLKFIETDTTTSIAVSGDAFTQSSFPTGNNVLIASGLDISAGAAPFAAAALIVTDGSNITNASVEDYNDDGNTAEVTSGVIGGTYTATTGGRATLTFTSGFENGTNGSGCVSCTFAAYPSSGGVQLLEIDSAGITAGTLFAQGSSTTLASAQGYGVNLTGTVIVLDEFGDEIPEEEDDIVEFTDNSGTLGPGVIDVNDGGSPTYGKAYSASYSADTTVSGRGTITPSENAYQLVTYGTDNGSQVVVSIDPNFLGVGFIEQQNATEKSNAAMAHLASLRLITARNKSMKKRNAR